MDCTTHTFTVHDKQTLYTPSCLPPPACPAPLSRCHPCLQLIQYMTNKPSAPPPPVPCYLSPIPPPVAPTYYHTACVSDSLPAVLCSADVTIDVCIIHSYSASIFCTLSGGLVFSQQVNWHQKCGRKDQ